jgi:hypothetical protein
MINRILPAVHEGQSDRRYAAVDAALGATPTLQTSFANFCPESSEDWTGVRWPLRTASGLTTW